MAGLRTEFEFTLPFGYVDNEGTLHRDGVMRMATAMDEIAPLRDPRVRNNQAYLTIILLARVVSRLGGLSSSAVTTDVIEKLFANDLAYLQSFYNDVNSGRLLNRGANDQEPGEVSCPACGHHFSPEHNHSAGNSVPNQEAELIATGGVVSYPLEQIFEEVAFIAYYFHWPLKQLLKMEHSERRRWVEQINRINEQMNEEPGAVPVEYSL